MEFANGIRVVRTWALNNSRLWTDSPYNITKLPDELDGSFHFKVPYGGIRSGTLITVFTPYVSKLYIAQLSDRDTDLSSYFPGQGWSLKEMNNYPIEVTPDDIKDSIKINRMKSNKMWVTDCKANSTIRLQAPVGDLHLAIFVKEGKY